MARIFFLVALIMGAAPASANGFVPVTDQSTFLSLVDGKTLRNRLYGVRLAVLNNGAIQGAAWGWDITGTWAWEDGYFCRNLAWGGDPIPYNCQLVEANGNNIRFTVDKGAGDTAAFSIN